MFLSEPAVEEGDYVRLRRLITAKSGLEFPASRRPQLEKAITHAVERLRLGDARHLWERLRDDAGRAELEELIASVTIGETYFFRNEPHFHALEHHVFPELIETHRKTNRLRIWSAGCSSGEEPYSLAMLLDRVICRIEDWDVMIIATDIDRGALRRASEGIYRSWSLRRTPEDVRARYFTRHSEQEWELDPRVRDRVTFRYLNLVDDAYPSLFTNIHAMDLVVCRNVLIYFGDATVRAVADKLRASVADQGWLVVGHAEPSRSVFGGFAPRNFPGAVLYQKEPSAVSPTGAASHPAPMPARTSDRSSPAPPRPEPAERPPAPDPPESSDPCGDALELWRQGRLDEAARALERAASEHPDDPRPPYLLGKLHADRLEGAEAGRWIAEALKRDDLFAPAYYVAGLIAEEEGRIEDAIGALRRCAYADRAWPLAHFALGRCFLKAGRKPRATVVLDNAIRLLEDRDPEEPVLEGDGVTAGRLLELTRIQKEVSGIGPPRGVAHAG